MGYAVERLNAAYVVAEDSCTSVADMRLMAEVTRHVGGLADAKSAAPGRTGDPSPATALAAFIGPHAAVLHKFDRAEPTEVPVASQGVRNLVRDRGLSGKGVF